MLTKRDAETAARHPQAVEGPGGAGHLRGVGRRGGHGPRHATAGSCSKKCTASAAWEYDSIPGAGAARDGEGGSQHHGLPHREGAFPRGHRGPAERRRAGLSRVSRVHGVPDAGKQLPADRARRDLLRAHHRGRLRRALSGPARCRAWAAAGRRPMPTRRRLLAMFAEKGFDRQRIAARLRTFAPLEVA